MDETAMVSVDISRGSELLEVLDVAKIKVNVAMWALLAEYEDWRLIVAGRRFDTPDPRDAYGLLNALMDGAGFTSRTTPIVFILPTNDPFIRQLRKMYGKTKSVEGMRIGGQLISDRFVHDAYVYRIS